jgi:hypothetical protein
MMGKRGDGDKGCPPIRNGRAPCLAHGRPGGKNAPRFWALYFPCFFFSMASLIFFSVSL